jgi:anaerobic ribonucleoside-triphosphate reductase activating protein
MHPQLNIAVIDDKGTTLLGPGKRFVIWVQGCQRRCSQCVSPDFQPLEPRLLLDSRELAVQIAAHTELQGVTISGGEPFLQASKLTDLLIQLKKLRPDMNVIVFTGYEIEQLNWDKAQMLLNHIDLLIDGPYEEELYIGQGLRGSSNQRFHFLTDRLTAEREAILNHKHNREIRIFNDGILIVGIPRKNEKLLSNITL